MDVTKFPTGVVAHFDEFYADQAVLEKRVQELRDGGFTVLKAVPNGFGAFKEGFNDSTGRE